MQRIFLYAKIHQARVTHADLNYEGSLSIDQELLQASHILENEQIQIYNIDNAARLTTYAISAPHGSRIIGANGACAHLVRPGHRIIICAFASMEPHEWENFSPTVLFLDEKNNFSVKKKQLEFYNA
jgi:aspartate 1-decarboxylase